MAYKFILANRKWHKRSAYIIFFFSGRCEWEWDRFYHFFHFCFADDVQQFFGGKSKREFMDINAALGIADEGNVDIKDDFIIVSVYFHVFCPLFISIFV